MLLTIPTLLMTVLFGTLFFIERRTIWIGIFAVLWIGLVFTYLIVSLEIYGIQIGLSIVLFAIALFVIGIPFYFISFIWMLITSGIQLVRREGKRLTNFLSVGFGLFLIVWLIGSFFVRIPNTYMFLWELYSFLTFLVYYFFFLLFCFAVASLLNRIRLTKRPYDYVIVLGSGLIGEKVPPLLASRIDKGIELVRKQQSVEVHPKLIFTGGQGADEALAEGEAMARYAREKGIVEAEIIIEDQAVNTYENLLFSKRLLETDMEETKLDRKPRVALVTNNFHVFRSLLWARKVGLRCEGVGSKTRFYFWLNALIREFIGVVYMERKTHIIVLGLAFVLFMSQLFIW